MIRKLFRYIKNSIINYLYPSKTLMKIYHKIFVEDLLKKIMYYCKIIKQWKMLVMNNISNIKLSDIFIKIRDSFIIYKKIWTENYIMIYYELINNQSYYYIKKLDTLLDDINHNNKVYGEIINYDQININIKKHFFHRKWLTFEIEKKITIEYLVSLINKKKYKSVVYNSVWIISDNIFTYNKSFYSLNNIEKNRILLTEYTIMENSTNENIQIVTTINSSIFIRNEIEFNIILKIEYNCLLERYYRNNFYIDNIQIKYAW